ncbi:MAG: PilZ domain-containing protein [Nitrospiraceae bacterium]|nr:PilZ domain-containing protein [Nitrospiraceae bacterium]
MKASKVASGSVDGNVLSATDNRRRSQRHPVDLRLMYSGLVNGDLIFGDGRVIDLSKGGCGIRGNQAVRPGMDLTVFLYLPHSEEPLFIAEMRVAWAAGTRFGAQYRLIAEEERARLQVYLESQLLQ